MIYYPSYEIFRYQKLLHPFKTCRTILIEVTPLYFSYVKHKTHKTFSYLTYSIFLLPDIRTREYCTLPLSNLSCTPKPMQIHYKLSKIEKNEVIGIIFFFCKNFLSPVDSGRKNSEALTKFRRSYFTKSTL